MQVLPCKRGPANDRIDEGELRMSGFADWADEVSRRRFLGVGAAAVGSAVLFGCGSSGGGSKSSTGIAAASFDGVDSITIANWGGTTAEGMMRAWAAPFTKKTGIKVTQVSPVDYSKVRSQVESGNVTWDWIDAEGWFPFGEPDLLDTLDAAALGYKDSDFVEGLTDAIIPNGIASYLTSYVIGYKSDRKGAHPSNWEEFFDTKAVPGKRSIYNWPYGMVDIVLLGDGVPYEDLYPLDLDRAFNKLDSMRDDLMFFNTGAESQQQLVSGSADFLSPWNNRVGYLAQGGLPVAIEWTDAMLIGAYHVVIKGSKAKRATEQFIKTALEPQKQADMALYSGYAPTRKDAIDLVDEKVRPWLPTQEDNLGKSAGFLNDEWWGANLSDVSAKWTEWASS
jgi:putative spermidine/putrescine transport system substrate-binding protein